MPFIKTILDYTDGQNTYKGLFVQKQNQQARATILIAHTWNGRGDFVEKVAERLCELGFQAFALDMYGNGVYAEAPAQCEALMKPLVENRNELQKRVCLAFDTIKKHPAVDDKKVIAIGYCFGGLCVLDLARSGADVLGVVSFHGLLHSPQQASQAINTKILVLHGHDDPMVPVEQVNQLKQELTSLKADWQIHAYGNTVHAFTNKNANISGTAMYSETSDKRSWKSMQGFFEELLANN